MYMYMYSYLTHGNSNSFWFTPIVISLLHNDFHTSLVVPIEYRLTLCEIGPHPLHFLSTHLLNRINNSTSIPLIYAHEITPPITFVLDNNLLDTSAPE